MFINFKALLNLNSLYLEPKRYLTSSVFSSLYFRIHKLIIPRFIKVSTASKVPEIRLQRIITSSLMWLQFASYPHPIAVLFVLALVHIPRAVDARERQPVLLVSLDGFRYDYLKDIMMITPTFTRFRYEGVSVDHMVPTFTTKTFPCHTSIITGNPCLISLL